MHVAIYASALPALGPRMVGKRARSVWNATRDDDVLVHLLSEGVVVDHVGTGLDDVVLATDPAASSVLASGEPRRIWWVSHDGSSALCDLADSATWSGEGDPRGSTAFLGTDILRMVESGVSTIYLHVPRLMRASDAGVGMLFRIAGMDEPTGEPSVEEIVAGLNRARVELGPISLILTYPDEVSLTGVNGVARAWADMGFDQQLAQDSERQTGQILANIRHAASLGMRRSLLNDSYDPARTSFSGVGGGLGMMVAELGGSVRRIGELLALKVNADVDLFVYICDAIGMDLPSGLAALTSYAEELGAPVVVITDSSGLRKGELPKLGLHGAYELRPNRAFLGEPNSMADLAEIPMLLDDVVARVAQTWGWDA